MEGYFVCDDEKSAVRAIFNITDEEVELKLQQLKEWTRCHPSLPPEAQDEGFLNIMLLRAKFRDDYVRKNIENYFRTIGKYPEIFAKLGRFKPSEEVGIAIASPRLTPNLERIGILKLSPKILSSKNFDINQMIIVTVTTGIIMFNNDYVAGVRFLLDFSGFTVRDVLKVNLRNLFKLVDISENMLRIRISGIELYNAPRIISFLLKVARVLLKPKMFLRVSVHNDLTSLYQNISRECLPCDYGGELPESCENLTELWDHIIEANAEFFEKVAIFSEQN